MTNQQIIALETITLIDKGIITATEQIHTFQKWKSLGYSVKKGQHAIAKFPIWKNVVIKDKDGNELKNKMIFKLSAFFKSSQVEKITEVK